MKRMIRYLTTILLCVSVTSIAMLPAYAATGSFNGNQSSTVVSLQQLATIQSKTPDFTMNVGDDATLQIIAVGSDLTYQWQVSTDGGASYGSVLGTESSYSIVDAKENNPALTPYFYRVTVTDSLHQTATAIIRVLVHNNYQYGILENATTGISVTGFVHESAELVVVLMQAETVPSDLQAMLRPEYAPLATYEVYLKTADGIVLPAYVGRLDITFSAGSSYDGETLNVYHKKSSGSLETLSATVQEGALCVQVDELSPFLLEVKADSLQKVTVTCGPNGNVSPFATVYVPTGKDKTFVFTPHQGYLLDTVTVDGTPVSVFGNSYTIKNVTSAHTLHATFKRPSGPSGGGGGETTSYTITIPGPSHGRTSPTGTITAKHGDSLTVYFYPDKGYELDSLLINGVKVAPGKNSYTFTVIENTAVQVSFQETTVVPPVVTRTISAGAGEHGTISPKGEVTVTDGGDLYFYFVPDPGYAVDTVMVDGVPVDAGSSWHFINITSDHSIHVTFKALGEIPIPPPDEPSEIPTDVDPIAPDVDNPEQLDPSGAQDPGSGVVDPDSQGLPEDFVSVSVAVDGSGGSVSPAGEMAVEKGGTQTFYFYPHTGYELGEVLVNGKPVDAGSDSYTVENMDEDASVVVTFRPIDQPQGTLCRCIFCRFWRTLIPGAGCACPWCWLIPLLFLSAIIGFVLYKYQRKTKKKDVSSVR